MIPKYVHIGLTLNEDGTKMSKRTRSEVLRKHLKMLIETGQETLESLTEEFIGAGIMNPDGRFKE